MSDPTPLTPDPALRALVSADCEAIKRRRRRGFAIFSVFGLGTALGMGFVMGVESPGAGSLAHTLLLGAYAVAGLGLCALAFGLTIPSGRLLRPVVGVGVLAALALLSLTVQSGGTGWSLVSPSCFAGGGLYSVGVIVAGVLLAGQLTRRHAPSGALLGVGAGLLGMVPLHLHCTNCSPGHVMVWHGLVPVAAGLFAWLAFKLRRI